MHRGLKELGRSTLIIRLDITGLRGYRAGRIAAFIST